MTWQEWLEKNQYDVDFGNDTIDLMKQAYIAGLQTAYDIMYSNEDGDYDFIMWSLKKLIGESE
jgi:hypothetical protein